MKHFEKILNVLGEKIDNLESELILKKWQLEMLEKELKESKENE